MCQAFGGYMADASFCCQEGSVLGPLSACRTLLTDPVAWVTIYQ